MITTLSEANLAIALNYLSLKETLPSEAQTSLDEIVGNPILPAKVSGFLELGYKYRDLLTDAQKQAVTEVGQFAYEHRFYGLGQDEKGYKMIAVINGDMTEEQAFPMNTTTTAI